MTVPQLLCKYVNQEKNCLSHLSWIPPCYINILQLRCEHPRHQRLSQWRRRAHQSPDFNFHLYPFPKIDLPIHSGIFLFISSLRSPFPS